MDVRNKPILLLYTTKLGFNHAELRNSKTYMQ